MPSDAEGKSSFSQYGAGTSRELVRGLATHSQDSSSCLFCFIRKVPHPEFSAEWTPRTLLLHVVCSQPPASRQSFLGGLPSHLRRSPCRGGAGALWSLHGSLPRVEAGSVLSLPMQLGGVSHVEVGKACGAQRVTRRIRGEKEVEVKIINSQVAGSTVFTERRSA